MRHRPIFLICLTLALTLSDSCVSFRTAATLNDIATYIQDRPDSALSVIRAIDTTTLTTRRLRAHYALLNAMALEKNWIDTTDENVVMPAVIYYGKRPSKMEKAKAWYYLGRIQQNSGLIEDAGVSFLKSEHYAKDCSDLRFLSILYQSISGIYGKTHFHSEALRYTELSYACSMKICDTVGANVSLYRMAQDLNNLGRYSESDSLFQRLIDEESIHPNLRKSLLCSYAINLLNNSDNYEKSRELLDKVLSTYGSFGNYNCWGAYAYSLARMGETERADSLFRQLETKNKAKYSYAAWKSLVDAYIGNYASAYRLQKAASDIQEENVNKVLNQSAIKAQKDFLEQVNIESEKLTKKRQIVAGGSIALLLSVILMLILFFRHRKLKNAQEKEDLLDAYKSLTMEHLALNASYSDLSVQVNQIEKEKASAYSDIILRANRIEREKATIRNKYIQLCQSHFSRIGRINEVLYYHSADKDNKLYKELKQAVRNIGMDSKGQSEFEILLDEAFDNVMSHFRAAFPNKKPRYYQLASYLFAGFDSSTICAIIPGFQKHNVHVEKYRLKLMIRESDTQYKGQFLSLLS